jgi:hypothetical protein
MDYLASREDVVREHIAAVGQGSLGVPLLHAALLDKRIGKVVLQQTLVSYRQALDHAIDRELYDVLVPGVLKKYDLPELATALKPRQVVLVNPVDQAGKVVPGAGKYRAGDAPLHEFLR